MSTDSAVSIAWDVLKCLVAPIKRGFSYVMSSESYANNLRKEVGNLQYEAERVRSAAGVAENNRRRIHGWVPEFLASAEKALIEAEDLLGEFEKASKPCCHGTLPDPSCRYQFSRKAKHKTDDIKNLILENSNKEISFSGPAPGNVTALIRAGREGKDVVQSNTTAASASSVDFESRALMIQNIMDALVDNRYSVVGVHGMGGVGKSTLLVDAERRIREKNLFDWVAKADVSQNPDVKKIQEEIAHWLGLNDIKKEDNVSLRAELLRERLEDLERKKNKVLIILDNLWEQLDLKVVGIPCGVDNKVIGCKLLLTSRDRNVLQRDMACDKEFPLDMLEENEARTLFEKMVGDKVHDDEFRTLVDEALRKCTRLPLLIVTMAKHFKYAGLSEWRDALNQIERCSNEGVSAVINKMLQLSYDHLKSEEAKSLLQLCVTYGVSEPSLENLMRYGYGLGIFPKDSSMNEARDRLSTLICTLQASSLLLDNGGADRFKIHDLVHDFVAEFVLRDRLLLGSKDKDMLATQLQKERLKSCSAICFPYIDMNELPKELDCPELRIFLLFNNKLLSPVSYSYFNSMRKLAVLDLTGIQLTCSPTPFQFLENLHTLYLQSCLVKDVAILGKLKGLRILSFMGSLIKRLPKEIGQLVELRLLDLNHCFGLRIIEPGVLGKLIKLEELYIENSFNQWNPVEQSQPTNASLIELNHMKNLCTLHVFIPDPSVLPKDLNVKKLSKYRIQIGNTQHRGKYKGSSTLELNLNSISNVIKKGCIQSILSKTDNLFLEELNETEQSICALSQEGFPKLKHLQVLNSPSVHYINISSSKSFSILKVIQVKSCDKMKALFPLSLLRGFPQLEEIEVVSCQSMGGIVEVDCDKVELHNLHVLLLRDLPNIKNFFTIRTTPSSSKLDNQIGTQIAFFNGQQDSRYIQHLQTLDVSHCDGLSKMFTPTIAENLVALTKLRISNCRVLTEVINDEKGGDGHVVAFNQLKYMELDGLIELRNFSSGGYTLMFPLLEDIIVTRCPNMKFFSQGPTEASKLKRVQVSKEAWFWAGNLNITIQNMFEEMGTFVGVEKMLLSEFPGLIAKWHNGLNPIKSCWQLKSMVVDKCPSFINAIPSRLMLVLDNLSILQVHDCKLLEEIFDLEGLEVVESTRVLPKLHELNLANLPKLRRLWNKDLQESIRFDSLATLILYNCSNLGHAFTSSMAQCLANLYRMEIKECGQMEEVIVEEEGQGSAMDKITFPKLRQMKLEWLPNLTCFLSTKNHTMECSNLQMLSINHCPKMRSLTGQSQMDNDHGTPAFFTSQVQFPKLWSMDLSHMDNLSKIWTDAPQETLTFDCLWKVEVRNCKGLENLFPYWVATSLTQLGRLQVESCEIEEIVASGNDTPRSNTTQDLFPKLTSLVLHDMPRLKSFCPNLPLNLPLLEELRVTHCEKLSMLSFVASMNRWAQRDDQQDLSNQEAHSSFERDFPNLERLLLVDNNIQMIQDGNFSDDMFSKLKALTLACFHDKKAAFPSIFLLERFQNLQSLEVLCSSFEDLFPNEGLVEERKHPVLENLRELKLNKLHNLKCVWKEDSLVSKILQSIETFEVWDCPCLTTIFPTETSFQNLTYLVVKNSSGLVHLVTTSAVTNLVHLTSMTIIGCERMKEVVADDGNKEGKVISFEKLRRLTLEHLPNLECFSSIPSCIFRFPSLWRIEVEECSKMKTFSKSTLSTPKLYDVSLFKYKWEENWEKGDDLNTTIQKLAA